jgi:hypothetical protein
VKLTEHTELLGTDWRKKMSNNARIKSQILDLKAMRTAVLEGADQDTRKADQLLRKAGSPPRPQDAYEHRRSCESEAARLRRSADSARRNAERINNEIRGLERYLS